MPNYENDIAILKKYKDDLYKITFFRQLRVPADDSEDKDDNSSSGGDAGGDSGNAEQEERVPVRDDKFDSSLRRSRSKIHELAIVNPWEWFCTMTIDESKHDRSDLKSFQKRLGKWFNNYNFNNGMDIKYLLIPELHRDKTNWHLHGLMMGLDENHLTQFTLQDKLPLHMKKLLREGRELYNLDEYAAAFGWVSLERIRKPENVAHYLTKYITKGLGKKIKVHNHVYYCSKGLQRAEELYRGELRRDLDPDYENEYMAVKTVRGSFYDAIYYFTDDNE